MLAESNGLTALDVIRLVVSREGDRAHRLLLAQSLHQIPASAVREVEIANQNIKITRPRHPEGGLDAIGKSNCEAAHLEVNFQSAGGGGVVFDNENSFLRHLDRLSKGRQRQPNDKHGAARLAERPHDDGTAVSFDDRFRNVAAEADVADAEEGATTRFEWIEDDTGDLIAEFRAAIFNADFDLTRLDAT